MRDFRDGRFSAAASPASPCGWRADGRTESAKGNRVMRWRFFFGVCRLVALNRSGSRGADRVGDQAVAIEGSDEIAADLLSSELEDLDRVTTCSRRSRVIRHGKIDPTSEAATRRAKILRRGRLDQRMDTISPPNAPSPSDRDAFHGNSLCRLLPRPVGECAR
jgi:hypothetical protein